MKGLEQLVLASNNPGKLEELRAILAPLSIAILAQGELGITEAEEPHHTFVENALAKARHASRASRLPALADDSGICVAALGGDPGVHSAHYAGAEGDRATRDARNNAKLLAELARHADNSAHYYCVLVLVRRADDPQPLVTEGVWRGEIIASPRGANGFGYDPLFLVPDLGRTAAQLNAEEKNRISHRGKALRRLIARLQEQA